MGGTELAPEIQWCIKIDLILVLSEPIMFWKAFLDSKGELKNFYSMLYLFSIT